MFLYRVLLVDLASIVLYVTLEVGNDFICSRVPIHTPVSLRFCRVFFMGVSIECLYLSKSFPDGFALYARSYWLVIQQAIEGKPLDILNKL